MKNIGCTLHTSQKIRTITYIIPVCLFNDHSKLFSISMIALFRKLRKEKMHRSNSSQLLSSKVIWGLSAYFLHNLEHPSYFRTFSQIASDDQERGMGDSSKDKLLDIRGFAILNFRSKWRPEKRLAGTSVFFSYIQDPSDL